MEGIEIGKKPPLGIMPMWLHNEIRYRALREAMKRYEDAGLDVHKEWIAEAQSLEAYLLNTEQTKNNFVK